MITGRQEKLLDFVIREYITTTEPVSSLDLKQIADLDICASSIRNDLQALTKEGYIEQPHTSAGRIPTRKAYKYFADKIAERKEIELEDFIIQQIKQAHQQVEQEMKMAQELMASLSETSITLKISHSAMPASDDLFEILNLLGSSKTTFNQDMDIINEIIKKLGKF